MTTTLAELSLVDRPVEEVVHDIALRFMDKASAASRRLGRPEDQEALHDFRVALRRLRTWLKAYGPRLKIGEKLQAPLGDLMHRTNGARDAEVGLAWLETQRDTLDERQLIGLTWFAAQLEEERRHAHHVILSQVPGEWVQQDGKLRKRLSKAAAHHGSPAGFGHAAGIQILEYVEKLAERVAGVNALTDLASAHRARISAKHLRYLLEPLCTELAEAQGVVTRLTDLQDELGALHDASVLLDRLIDATETAAMEDARTQLAQVLKSGFQEGHLPAVGRRDARPGLLILTYRAKQYESGLFQQVIGRLHDRDTIALLNDARALGESLTSASGPH